MSDGYAWDGDGSEGGTDCASPRSTSRLPRPHGKISPSTAAIHAVHSNSAVVSSANASGSFAVKAANNRLTICTFS